MDGVINVDGMEYCTQMDCTMVDCLHHPRNIPEKPESLRARNMREECKYGR